MEVGFRADIILDDKVILEIKSIEALADIQLTGLKLGLIVNFNVGLLKDGIKRVANNV